MLQADPVRMSLHRARPERRRGHRSHPETPCQRSPRLAKTATVDDIRGLIELVPD